METPNLILSFFSLGLTSFIGLSLSSARVEIRTLRARLDRQDALEAKNYIKVKVEPPTSKLYIKLFSLEAEIACKDETIKNLNGDIAKLKYDYACEVAERNGEPGPVRPFKKDWKDSPVSRGEWIDESAFIDREKMLELENRYKSKPVKMTNDCECCAGSGENRLGDECQTCCGTGQINPTKRKVGKPLSMLDDLETDENKTE